MMETELEEQRIKEMQEYLQKSPHKNFRVVVQRQVKTDSKGPRQFIDLEKSLLKE